MRLARVFKVFLVLVLAFAVVLVTAGSESSVVRSFDSPLQYEYLSYFPTIGRNVKDVEGKGVGVHAAYFDAAHLQLLQVGYWHNWHWTGENVPGTDYFATIWEPYDGCRDIPTWARGVIGGNEPDGQSGVSPSTWAVNWHDYMEPCYYGEYPLGTPTPSHINPHWLDSWLEAFNELYDRDPYFDFVTANCYGSVDACKVILEGPLQIAEAFDVPLMIKEWAYLPCFEGGISRALDEMDAIFEWQTVEPRVRWVSWFIDSMQCNESWAFSPECDTSLFVYGTQTLTVLGEHWMEGG